MSSVGAKHSDNRVACHGAALPNASPLRCANLIGSPAYRGFTRVPGTGTELSVSSMTMRGSTSLMRAAGLMISR